MPQSTPFSSTLSNQMEPKDLSALFSFLLPGIPVESLPPDKADALMILAATAYMYSLELNPRLLEDASHLLWAYDTAKLCANHPLVLRPVPQFRIDVSPKDVAQNPMPKLRTKPNSKHSNTADASARGVICDFAVIFPLYTKDPFVTPKVITELFGGNTWEPHEWHAFLPTIKSNHLLALALTELKRPIIRDPSNLGSYVSCISARIHEAKEQLLSQAFCLFSSIRFKHQNEVILKAGAGEWWCFTTISREEMKEHQKVLAFTMRNYRFMMSTVTRLAEENDKTFKENMAMSYDSEFFSLDEVQIMAQDGGMAKLKKERQQAMQKKVLNDELRDKRRRNRDAGKNLGQNTDQSSPNPEGKRLDEYQTLSSMTEDYTDADLVRFSQLAPTYGRGRVKLLKLQFDPSPDEKADDLKLATYHNLQWSPVTRMKSPISDAWTTAIQESFSTTLANERAKWDKIQEEMDKEEEKATEETREALQRLHVTGA